MSITRVEPYTRLGSYTRRLGQLAALVAKLYMRHDRFRSKQDKNKKALLLYIDCLPLLAPPLKIVVPSIAVASKATPSSSIFACCHFDNYLPVLMGDAWTGLL